MLNAGVTPYLKCYTKDVSFEGSSMTLFIKVKHMCTFFQCRVIVKVRPGLRLIF